MLPSSQSKHIGGSGSGSSSQSSAYSFFASLRRKSRCRSFGIFLAVVILIFQLLNIFLFNASFFFMFDTAASHLPTAGTLAEIDKIVQRIASEGHTYNPQRSVAFAIPVGGRTERSASLQRIIQNLLDGGARKQNIFVFEDVESRAERKPSQTVRQVVDQFNAKKTGDGSPVPAEAPFQISIISTEVIRYKPEDENTWGIHLARHYKYMLDYLLAGDTNEQLLAASQAADQRKSEASIGIAVKSAISQSVGTGQTFDFVVVIEDDLVLAPDFVKYFLQMSRVMRADQSIYCVSAHQDNAFLATSEEEPPTTTKLNRLNFAFRRGNHFMAPGWMTSKFIYLNVVKDRWLDDKGDYKYKERLHLKNGHWDRFFDSLIAERDCIFPEIPRIIHEGAGGFTVSKKGQMELYSNLRLSQLPVSTQYTDLSSLSQVGYSTLISEFIAEAKVLTVLEEVSQYNHDKLVYVVTARDDKDWEWNAVLNNYFGVIGVGGYGGFEGYVKVRGIFRGAVFVRWLGNLVLLVATYSPYIQQVTDRAKVAQWHWGITLKHEGCFPAMLFHQEVKHYTYATVSASKCLLSCLHLGYRYAGVIHGSQCRCTNALYSSSSGDLQTLDAKVCSDTCLGAAAHSALQSSLVRGVTSLLGDKEPCGAEHYASVYSVDNPNDADAKLLSPEFTLAPPSFAQYVAGAEGESCDQACAKLPSAPACREDLFPLIHRSCAALEKLLGCTRCEEEMDIEKGFATPGRTSRVSNVCTFSKGKYIQCAAKPPQGFLRACVCEKKVETAAIEAQDSKPAEASLGFLGGQQ